MVPCIKMRNGLLFKFCCSIFSIKMESPSKCKRLFRKYFVRLLVRCVAITWSCNQNKFKTPFLEMIDFSTSDQDIRFQIWINSIMTQRSRRLSFLQTERFVSNVQLSTGFKHGLDQFYINVSCLHLSRVVLINLVISLTPYIQITSNINGNGSLEFI